MMSRVFNPSQRATRRTTTELTFYPLMRAREVSFGASDPYLAEALGGLVGTVGAAAASEALKAEQAYQAQQEAREQARQVREQTSLAARQAEATKTTAKWLIGTVLVLTAGSFIYKKYGRA